MQNIQILESIYLGSDHKNNHKESNNVHLLISAKPSENKPDAFGCVDLLSNEEGDSSFNRDDEVANEKDSVKLKINFNECMNT